jgi:predicted RNA-binding protein with PIN domain
MSQARLIIVDGYNLILRSPHLKPGPDRTLREAREKLLNLLSWTVGAGEARFIVVFDGDQGASEPRRGGGRVEVRWSKPPAKADDVIRALVEERCEGHDRLTVVTSDLEVARHARAMGADVALADLFVTSLLGPARAGESPEKPAGLSKRELEEWAEMFRNRPPEQD